MTTPEAGPSIDLAAVVFDMDGLLIDSEPLWRETEIAIFGRLGVPLTDDRCRETRGMVLGEVARHWYERYPWKGPTPDDVAAEVIDAMAARHGAGVVAKPGAVHALEWCRNRGLPLAVASSSPRRLIDLVVHRMGLDGWFAVLHSAQEEAAGKPDPAVFLTTATLLGVAPERCVVFEDSPSGVRAAVAAGMVCVAVPEGDGSEPGSLADDVAAADVIIGSLEEVGDALWDRLVRRRESRAHRVPPGSRSGGAG